MTSQLYFLHLYLHQLMINIHLLISSPHIPFLPVLIMPILHLRAPQSPRIIILWHGNLILFSSTHYFSFPTTLDQTELVLFEASLAKQIYSVPIAFHNP